MKRNVISLICNQVHQESYSFYKTVAESLGGCVYFIVDSCIKPNFFEESELIKFVAISDKECIENNFINCMITEGPRGTWIRKNPMGYDKMVYFFSKVNIDYDFALCLEDDVFILNVETISNFFKNYSNYDLVTPNNFHKTDKVWDWHWLSVIDKINEPYYYSMVCTFGFSKNLMYKISNYVLNNQTLFYIEVMFNTIAMQNNLKVTDCFELKSIVWLGSWGVDEFRLLPNNFFHPMKDLDDYENLRSEWIKCSKLKRKPKNNLPPFIKNLM
jgi:hypothetical protein